MNEEKCMVAEQVMEGVMGAAVGIVLTNNIYPKCDNGFEKTVVTLGTIIGMWTFARKVFAPTWLKFCDNVFDTDFKDVIDQL